MSEVFVKCPKCGEKLQLILTPMLRQAAEKRFVKSGKQVQAQAVSEPEVELDVEGIDWKPWRQGTGEWVNIIDATGLFMKIQNAGGQLEHDGYRYWIFGNNKDIIARKRTQS